MSVVPIRMYRVVCDEPGCEVSAQDGNHYDYYAWVDPEQAEDDALDGDWLVTEDGKHYCTDHRLAHDQQEEEE